MDLFVLCILRAVPYCICQQMGGLEAVATGVIDEFGDHLKKYKWHRELFMLVTVAGSFLAALPTVTQV